MAKTERPEEWPAYPAIRPYNNLDRYPAETVYRRAFAGPPWNEQLTPEEVARRVQRFEEFRGARALVAACSNVRVMGFICWDQPTLTQLRNERGHALAQFVSEHGRQNTVVWIRETCVDPEFQGKGVARLLKQTMFLNVCNDCSLRLRCRNNQLIILTRLRHDNAPIIRLNEELGFRRTGILDPSRTQPGVMHEYWYYLLRFL